MGRRFRGAGRMGRRNGPIEAALKRLGMEYRRAWPEPGSMSWQECS